MRQSTLSALLSCVVALPVVLSSARAARADQLQCNSAADAERAVALLIPGSIIIDYCSLCDATARVVRVARTSVLKSCDYEVQVEGTEVAVSTATFHEKYDAEAQYRPRESRYSEAVDLAYVYVETSPNTFDWLGGVLQLKARVNTRTIHLPATTYAALGAHPTPAVAAVSPPPARTKVGALGFSLFEGAALNMSSAISWMAP